MSDFGSKTDGKKTLSKFASRMPGRPQRVRPPNQAQPSPNVCIRFTMDERIQIEHAVAASDGAFVSFAQFVRSSAVSAAGALLAKKGRK